MSWPGGNCADAELRQAMDGAVSGCLQVAAVAAGAYTVSLQGVLSSAAAIAGKGGAPATRASGPSLKLSVSPASGPPGTRVTITGIFSTPPKSRVEHADLCWDGCPGGLEYGGVPVTWSSATTFTTSIVTPAAPWLTSDPARVVMLTSGRYSIGVQCLEELKGCAVLGPQAVASFDLRVPPGSAPTWCATPADCAELNVTPDAAFPGQPFTVHGFAPLTSVIGSDQPFAYQWQVFAGTPSGPAVRFDTANAKGGVEVYFGKGVLTVEPARTFASLGHVDVVSELASGPPAITADPNHPSTLAWCSGSSVVISTDGKTTVLPTLSALTELRRPPIQRAPNSPPRCTSAVVLPGADAGDAQGIAAAFVVAPSDQDPMSAEVPLVTRDAGQTWTPIPVPAGARSFGFGGFRYENGEPAALFMPAQGAQPLAESSADGGATWKSSAFACPDAGPCVTFGGYQIGNCAKGQGSEPVLYSTDGGRRWAQPAWANEVSTCGSSQLAATSDGSELLVTSISQYPLRWSRDGGATWADVALPLLPGQQPGVGLGIGQYGITLLPNGALLAIGESDGWLLAPGATSWCQAQLPDVPSLSWELSASIFTIAGGSLWWLSHDNDGNASIHGIPLSEVRC